MSSNILGIITKSHINNNFVLLREKVNIYSDKHTFGTVTTESS